MGKTIAVLLLSVVLSGCGGPPSSSPASRTPTPDRAAPSAAAHTATPTASPTAAHTAPREHRGWQVVERIHADLDGDGVTDTVRIREPDRLRGYEVVVALADRTVVLPRPRGWSMDFEPVDQADVDGVPGDELFVLDEMPVRTFTALRWRVDHFVAIPAPPGARLTDDLAPDLLAKGWWVRGDRVVSYRSVRPCRADAAAETVTCPDRMAVRAREWRVVDGAWRIRTLGRHCVSSDDPRRLLPPCGRHVG